LAVTNVTVRAQVKFKGHTGHVEFNDEGHRTNFLLSVLEQSVDNDVIKVRPFMAALSWVLL